MKLQFNNSYTSYNEWVEYFKENATKQIELLDELDENIDTLSNAEVNHISSTIKMFQQGEQSDGKNLRNKAKEFSQKSNYQMDDAIVLFIKEENNHSAFLSKIMKKNSIDIKLSKLDHLFRKFRHTLSLRASLNILLTAEIIAVSYYTILATATNSLSLNRLCMQMLSDENKHLQFQAYNNYALKTNNVKFSKTARRVFLSGSILALYISERKFFKENNVSLRQLLKNSNEILNQIIDLEKDIHSKFDK